LLGIGGNHHFLNECINTDWDVYAGLTDVLAVYDDSPQFTFMPKALSFSQVGTRSSNSPRAFFISGQFLPTQSKRARVGTSRLFPSPVNSYSTRGGTSGKSSRVISPSRSKLRRVSVSILCEIAGNTFSISEKRARQPGARDNDTTIRIVHLSPTFVRKSRTATPFSPHAAPFSPHAARVLKSLLPLFFS
jgi:hypothetical protein